MWFAAKRAEENTIVLEMQTAPSGQLHQQPLQVVPDDFRSETPESSIAFPAAAGVCASRMEKLLPG